MKQKHVFPHEAFEKEQGFSLSRLFKQRVYSADDVKSIRTSFFIETKPDINSDTEQHLIFKWASADREKDGNFAITTNEIDVKYDIMSEVSNDPIINRKTLSGRPDDTYIARCSQEEVLEKLSNLERLFRHNAHFVAPHVTPPVIRMDDAINIAVALEIFEHPCKEDEVNYHLERVRNINPQKIKFG